MRSFSFRSALALSLVPVLLVACGGGSDSASQDEALVSGPGAARMEGDYFVYSQTRTSSSGTVFAPTSVTHLIKAAHADGSLTRQNTQSDSAPSTIYELSAGRAVTSYVMGMSTTCSYAPAWRPSPASTAAATETFSSSSTQSCLNPSFGAEAATAFSVEGQVLGLETLILPVGDFPALKYRRTVVSTSSASTFTSKDVCWMDPATGLLLQCSSDYTSAATGQVGTSAGSVVLRLEAYRVRGQTPVGPVIRRFAGQWRMGFQDTAGDRCTLTVAATGQIRGDCQSQTSADSFVPFTVSGSVDASGVASLTSSTGAVLNGSLSSPFIGAGTWTLGATSRGWSASHL